MNIIGIAGTNGSGKDSVSQILVELGWCFVSVSSDIIIPELIRRGLPLERANMAAITEEWRKRSGPGVIIDKALELYKKRPPRACWAGRFQYPPPGRGRAYPRAWRQAGMDRC